MWLLLSVFFEDHLKLVVRRCCLTCAASISISIEDPDSPSACKIEGGNLRELAGSSRHQDPLVRVGGRSCGVDADSISGDSWDEFLKSDFTSDFV